jgi:hypothetical protein
MTDWAEIYRKLFEDVNGKRLWNHLSLIGGFVILGIILGVYVGHSINIILLVWFMGAIADYILYGKEILYLLNRDEPYLLDGTILERIKRITKDENDEIVEIQYFFIVEIEEIIAITKNGLDEEFYSKKVGEERLEVPESMFLSLEVGDTISVVCTPDELVWAWVREDDEVVVIEE